MPRPFLGYPHSRRIRGFGYRNYYSSGTSYSNGKKERFFRTDFNCHFGNLIRLEWWRHADINWLTLHMSMSPTSPASLLDWWLQEPLKLFNSKLASMLSLGMRVGHDQDPKNTNSSNPILASAKQNTIIWFWPYCSSKSHLIVLNFKSKAFIQLIWKYLRLDLKMEQSLLRLWESNQSNI